MRGSALKERSSARRVRNRLVEDVGRRRRRSVRVTAADRPGRLQLNTFRRGVA